ncbi:hypothetical protein JCM8547_003103 [Rhodosporidiobolus lusitaniae]
MSLSFTGRLTFVELGPALHGYNNRRVSFVDPGLSVPLTTAYDAFYKRYSVEWEGAVDPPYISGGHNNLGDDSELRKGRSPFTFMGSISSPHTAPAYDSATLNLTASASTSLEPARGFCRREPTHASSGRRAPAAYAFEESDDEGDEMEDEVKKDDVSSISSDNLLLKTITVTDTPYSTYLAVLVWLQSGHIVLSPLLSSFSSAPPRQDPRSARRAAVSSLTSNFPLLPPFVSPKSVFRLAHLLELDSLTSLALANLLSQLTPQNAAYELYSELALGYDVMRGVVLDYVVENWE